VAPPRRHPSRFGSDEGPQHRCARPPLCSPSTAVSAKTPRRPDAAAPTARPSRGCAAYPRGDRVSCTVPEVPLPPRTRSLCPPGPHGARSARSRPVRRCCHCDVGVDVPIDVGSPATTSQVSGASPVGGAGLRSLPAKQHAPKARPTTDHGGWPAGGVPSRLSSTNGLGAWTCAAAGSRTFALDRRASRPSCTTGPRASSWPVGRGRHPTLGAVKQAHGSPAPLVVEWP
jgi:hypothetical protein